MNNSEMFAGLMMVVIFIGVFYLIFWFIKRHLRKMEQQWIILADTFELNLNLPEGKWSWFLRKYPTIKGNIDGMPFYCYMYTRGSGKHQTTYTCFTLGIEYPRGKTLQVYKEGFFSKVGKAFGGQDIEMGHDDFDNNYIIKSNDELFAKRVLNARIRQLFLRNLPKMRGTFSLIENALEYNAVTILNNEKNREKWEQAIKVATQYAKEIQGR
jgi:hypothetical protein